MRSNQCSFLTTVIKNMKEQEFFPEQMSNSQRSFHQESSTTLNSNVKTLPIGVHQVIKYTDENCCTNVYTYIN